MIRFFLIFATIVGGGYVFLELDTEFTRIFTGYLAHFTHLLMGLFDSTAAIKPSNSFPGFFGIGRDGGFFVVVTETCSALHSMLLLYGAIIAFPSTVRAKIIGLILGGLAIQALNIIRLLSLIYIGEGYGMDIFDTVHENVWPLFLYIATYALFMFWLYRYVKPADTTADAAG